MNSLRNRRELMDRRAARAVLSHPLEAPRMADNRIYPVLKTEEEQELLRAKRLGLRFPDAVEARLAAIEAEIRRMAGVFDALVKAHAELQTAYFDQGREQEPRALPTVWRPSNGK